MLYKGKQITQHLYCKGSVLPESGAGIILHCMFLFCYSSAPTVLLQWVQKYCSGKMDAIGKEVNLVDKCKINRGA